jgi:hypothetical protein
MDNLAYKNINYGTGTVQDEICFSTASQISTRYLKINKSFQKLKCLNKNIIAAKFYLSSAMTALNARF